MSKLADAIRRSQRVEASPMGFGAPRPAPRPSMLVGFIGPAAKAADAKSAGADVIIAEDAADLAALRSAAGDLPAGVVSSDGAAAVGLKDAGLDFVLFNAASAPASLLLDEDRGHVVELPDAPDELFLRALEPLNLEAVYVKDVPAPLTVAAHMQLSRAGMLSRKPLIVRVSADASSEQLQSLRAAGTVVLVTDTVEGVSALKAAVAALPERKNRREERPIVSLPRGRVQQEDDDDDDDRLGRA